MRIAILSDIHLGHALGTERESDPFDVLEEFLEKNTDADVILLPGDIFDSRSPGTDVVTRAMKLFLRPMLAKNNVRLARGISKDITELSPIHSMGIPIVVISGTHERRAKGLVNVVQALEHAGFFIYLHCSGVVLEKDGESVCVQGMSGVPEQFADSVMKEWNPGPEKGCTNILMVHQNLIEFMHPQVGLKPSEFPSGFDLFACGHLHDYHTRKLKNGRLLICGSPVTTQIKQAETRQKVFWVFDTKTGALNSFPLEKARKVYIKSFDSSASHESMEKDIEKTLSAAHAKKPIIMVEISGKEVEVPAKRIVSTFEDRAIIYFKKDFEEERLPETNLEEHKLSVQELGKKLLAKNLKEMNLDPQVFENVFELLLENRADGALELLNKKAGGKQKAGIIT